MSRAQVYREARNNFARIPVDQLKQENVTQWRDLAVKAMESCEAHARFQEAVDAKEKALAAWERELTELHTELKKLVNDARSLIAVRESITRNKKDDNPPPIPYDLRSAFSGRQNWT